MSVTQGPWAQPERRTAPVEEFRPFSPAEWGDEEPPPYDWMVEGAMLNGTVAMLSGDGGLGKSLLMQQLCTCAATGLNWLGMRTKQCRTFMLACEDDKIELRRRQHKINKSLGVHMGDLEDMLLISRVGRENGLAEFDRRSDLCDPSMLFEQLRHAVRDFGAQLVVLDTLADVFTGNEIVRNQVRRFVTMLRQFAVQIQGCVVLTAHPSNEGINSGSGISGSRAWNNTVRSRLYLTRDTRREGQRDVDGDPNVRWLRTMKNNQGAPGGKLKLVWNDGVFKLPERLQFQAPYQIDRWEDVE